MKKINIWLSGLVSGIIATLGIGTLIGFLGKKNNEDYDEEEDEDNDEEEDKNE